MQQPACWCWVPVLVAIMAAAFSIYLLMKGLNKLWKPGFWVVSSIGGVAFVGHVAGGDQQEAGAP